MTPQHQTPSHWEAALAFVMVVCIFAVGYSTYLRVNVTETVCFQFKTVQQMQEQRTWP